MSCYTLLLHCETAKRSEVYWTVDRRGGLATTAVVSLAAYSLVYNLNEHLGLVTHLPLSNTDTAHLYTFFLLPNEPKTQ